MTVIKKENVFVVNELNLLFSFQTCSSNRNWFLSVPSVRRVINTKRSISWTLSVCARRHKLD